MISGDTVFYIPLRSGRYNHSPKGFYSLPEAIRLLYAVYRTTAITVVDFSVQVAGVEPAEGVRLFKR